MRRRWIGLIVFVVLAAVAAGVAWWVSRPDPDQVSARTPAGAPVAGSCWNVDEKTAGTAYPWPGKPVDCASRHTAEVYLVGQVDRDLAARTAKAKGNDAKLGRNLMYAQARRACTGLAAGYLGGNWHASRVQVIADWIKPASTGHFGCAVVEGTAPAAKAFAARTGSLRGALAAPDPLGVACVARDSGAQVYRGCDGPHDGEFVGTYTITPRDAPFDAAKVRAAATSGCGDLVTRYVGASRTDLRPAYVGPVTASDWLGSDQTYACYAVVAGEGTLTGSVKGIGSGGLPH
jgi:Septum formation